MASSHFSNKQVNRGYSGWLKKIELFPTRQQLTHKLRPYDFSIVHLGWVLPSSDVYGALDRTACRREQPPSGLPTGRTRLLEVRSHRRTEIDG